MDFVGFFRDALESGVGDGKISHAKFASMVGVSSAFVSRIATYRDGLPPEKHEEWADALRLTGARRRLFLDLAKVTCLPDELQPRLFEIIDGFEKSEAREKRLQSLLDQAEARIATLEAKGKAGRK